MSRHNRLYACPEIPPPYIFKETLSWAQFLGKVLDTRNKVAPLAECASRDLSSEQSGESWDMGVEWEGAVRLATEGWHEGLRLIEPLMAELRPELSTMIETVDWNHDVDACQLDVARYLEGEPECWLVPNIRRVAGQGRLIRICIGGFLSARIPAYQARNAGAALLSFVQLIEQAGHTTQIEYVFNVKNLSDRVYSTSSVEEVNSVRSVRRIETNVVVKSFGESLNLSRLAFVLAHPAMFRRIGFSYMEQMPREAAVVVGASIGGDYYGTYFPLRLCSLKGDIELDMQDNPECMINLETGKEWIQKQLERLGIELKKLEV